MKINQPAVAGTLESGDVMIRIAPLDTQDIDLQINSSVEKQFGDAIRTTILDVLARYNVRGVQRMSMTKAHWTAFYVHDWKPCWHAPAVSRLCHGRIANDFRFAATT